MTSTSLLLSTGSYRPDDTMCYQAGLPIDKFSFVSTRYH